MAEKKKSNSNQESKPAARKPRARKPAADVKPAVEAAEATSGAAVSSGELSFEQPVSKPPARKAAAKAATEPVTPAAAETPADAVVSDPEAQGLSGQEREALKAELKKELAEIRLMMKKATFGMIGPWKMPW